MLESFFHVFTKKWLRDVFRLAQGSGPPVLCGSLDRSLRVTSRPPIFSAPKQRAVCISAFALLLVQMDAWQMHSSDRHTVPLRHRARRRVSVRSSVNTEGVTAQHYNEDEDGAV